MAELINLTRDGGMCVFFIVVVAGLALWWAWHRMGDDG